MSAPIPSRALVRRIPQAIILNSLYTVVFIHPVYQSISFHHQYAWINNSAGKLKREEGESKRSKADAAIGYGSFLGERVSQRNRFLVIVLMCRSVSSILLSYYQSWTTHLECRYRGTKGSWGSYWDKTTEALSTSQTRE